MGTAQGISGRDELPLNPAFSGSRTRPVNWSPNRQVANGETDHVALRRVGFLLF
jgi:hypothetical protein